MRRWVPLTTGLTASAALWLGGCAGPTETAEGSGDRAPQVAPESDRRERQAVVRVDGMACPFCTYNIQRQLEALEGVEGVEVSLDAGEARVTLSEDEPASEAQLRRAVESAGFTPTEVTMP